MKLLTLLFFLSLLYPISSVASCLDEVATFATRICGEINRTGSRELLDAKGNLKGEVSSIVRKVLGNVGADVNGRKLSDVYENVLRKDLGKELFDSRKCLIQMVDVARAEVCEVKNPVSWHIDINDILIIAQENPNEINNQQYRAKIINKGPSKVVVATKYSRKCIKAPLYEDCFTLNNLKSGASIIVTGREIQVRHPNWPNRSTGSNNDSARGQYELL